MLFAILGATFLLAHFALFNSASEHSNSLSREDRASEQSLHSALLVGGV
jgi:hypothetical protein